MNLKRKENGRGLLFTFIGYSFLLRVQLQRIYTLFPLH